MCISHHTLVSALLVCLCLCHYRVKTHFKTGRIQTKIHTDGRTHTATGTHSWNHYLYKKNAKSPKVSEVYTQCMYIYLKRHTVEEQHRLEQNVLTTKWLMNKTTKNSGETMDEAKIDYLVSHSSFWGKKKRHLRWKNTHTQRKLCGYQLTQTNSICISKNSLKNKPESLKLTPKHARWWKFFWEQNKKKIKKNQLHTSSKRRKKKKKQKLSTLQPALSPGAHVPCRVSGSAARRWPSSGACVGRPPLSGGRSGPWPSS